MLTGCSCIKITYRIGLGLKPIDAIYINLMMKLRQTTSYNEPLDISILIFCDAFHTIVQGNLHKYQRGINQVTYIKILKNH